jgi:hypothetical protein
VRHSIQRRLIESGQLCGVPVEPDGRRRRRKCRRFAGHAGGHAPEFDHRPLTAAEKIERKQARKAALAEYRAKRIVHLELKLTEAQAKIESLRRSPGYRVQYRLVGGYFRLRRYVRFVRNRLPFVKRS